MNKEAQAWLGVIAIVVLVVGVLVITSPVFMEQYFDGKALKAIQQKPGDTTSGGGGTSVGGGGSTPTPPPGTTCSDNDHDGYTTCQNDCNDNNPNIHPGAIEYCGNSVDEDCDGVAQVCAANMSVQTTQSSYNYTDGVKLK